MLALTLGLVFFLREISLATSHLRIGEPEPEHTPAPTLVETDTSSRGETALTWVLLAAVAAGALPARCGGGFPARAEEASVSCLVPETWREAMCRQSYS